jgi:hypothetical protein
MRFRREIQVLLMMRRLATMQYQGLLPIGITRGGCGGR